jgi:hypothetical protein
MPHLYFVTVVAFDLMQKDEVHVLSQAFVPATDVHIVKGLPMFLHIPFQARITFNTSKPLVLVEHP